MKFAMLPMRKIVLRQYLSDSGGTHKSVLHHPAKYAEPNRPSYQWGLHARSSFITQLCNVPSTA